MNASSITSSTTALLSLIPLGFDIQLVVIIIVFGQFSLSSLFSWSLEQRLISYQLLREFPFL